MDDLFLRNAHEKYCLGFAPLISTFDLPLECQQDEILSGIFVKIWKFVKLKINKTVNIFYSCLLFSILPSPPTSKVAKKLFPTSMWCMPYHNNLRFCATTFHLECQQDEILTSFHGFLLRFVVKMMQIFPCCVSQFRDFLEGSL
jgi:hypothetical protein